MAERRILDHPVLGLLPDVRELSLTVDGVAVGARPGETIAAALQREKNIKHWSREWKIDLIVAGNPDWRDLYEDIVR